MCVCMHLFTSVLCLRLSNSLCDLTDCYQRTRVVCLPFDSIVCQEHWPALLLCVLLKQLGEGANLYQERKVALSVLCSENLFIEIRLAPVSVSRSISIPLRFPKRCRCNEFWSKISKHVSPLLSVLKLLEAARSWVLGASQKLLTV